MAERTDYRPREGASDRSRRPEEDPEIGDDRRSKRKVSRF